MKLIPLTQGKFAMVDDEDYEWLNAFKWYARRDGHTCYAVRNVARTGGGWTLQRMHRLLASAPEVDHIDGDGLNNQRHNLRAASRVDQCRNRRARRGGSSAYKGVQRVQGRWQARIRPHPGHLGYFQTEEEAALAYDKAARELFGPFAVLNFPQPGERSALTGELVAA